MIKALHIKNYLLIEDIQLDFQAGLTVITGETGAGKSLIIDSLELALGTRADPGVVRQGSDKAEIFVVFDAELDSIQQWLCEHDLQEGGEAILQRTIYSDRPSRAYINGRPVTLNSVKDLALRLIAIHGQSEHQTLQMKSTQRHILDGFAGILTKTQRLSEIASSIRRAQSERTSLVEKGQRLRERQELLEHQVDTLVQLQPATGEFSELKQDLLRLTHASELAQTLGEISHQLFYGDDFTVSNALSDHINRLNRLLDVDDSLKQHSEMLYEAQVRVDDVAREIRSVSERTEYDPVRIGEIEERMAALQRQGRIHNVSADSLPETIESLSEELSELQESLKSIVTADEKIELLKTEHRTLASQVTEARNKASVQLADSVTENMQNLGMEGGKFAVDLIAHEPDDFAGFGHENVRFVVSTAPGQEAGPLSTVASGGELSRLSLAIQVVASHVNQVPSIVFDEIDVGIGGKVAERVGRLLRTLGKNFQIFCITHLPQVAAKGDQQLNVTKTPGQISHIEIHKLDDQQRVMEIARMLSGAKITARTTEHARELLAQSVL